VIPRAHLPRSFGGINDIPYCDWHVHSTSGETIHHENHPMF